MISMLPNNLKEELIYDANGYFLEYIPWLKDKFSTSFMHALFHTT